MSGIQQILLSGPFGGAAAAGDPYWQYTTLLSGTGTTNGAQNNTFTDSSSNAFSITRNGNTTQGSFSPFSAPNGYWGNYFDGTGDYLSPPVGEAFNFGTSAFTVECWAYFNSTAVGVAVFGNGTTAGNTSNGVVLYFSASGTLKVWGPSVSGTVTSTSVTTGQWTHLAVTRSSNTFTLYVNGVSQGTFTDTGSISGTNSSSPFNIGSLGLYTSYVMNGYISNFRVVKGTAVYTANFTPPTSPLTAITNTSLLTCQSNRFVDNSSNAFAITANGNVAVVPFANFGNTTAYSASSVGGSGYFDGTGDYLQTPSTAQLDFGTGDFTIEFWMYPTVAQVAYAGVMAQSTDSDPSWFVQYDANGTKLRLTTWSDNVLVSASTIPINTWTHIAMVRSGSSTNNVKLYINGVQDYQNTYTWDVGRTDSLIIGGGYAGGGRPKFQGYLSGLRIVNGSAVYTSGFTPPTAPPTAIANTQLLLNYTNAGIYDQAAKNDMETVGNAQVSTSVVKYGSGSIAFDGTGDFMVMPYSQMFNFGTGDFTLECWAKITYVQYTAIISSTSTSISTGQWLLGFSNTANQMSFAIDSGGSAIVGADFSNYLNTWTHIAVARTGGVLKLFFNGNQVASVANTTNFTGDTANPVVMGRRYTNSTDYPLNGNVSDLRITKGFARYTYNFTPPTQAFANFYSAPVTPTADPYFDYTTLLLPGSGTNGAQNNTFLDSSTNAFSITRNGNTTQGTFSPFSQTGWSNYFDGTSDNITAPAANYASYINGTGDFTIEFWVYYNALPTGSVGAATGCAWYAQDGGSAVVAPFCLIQAGNTWYLYADNDGSGWDIFSGTTLATTSLSINTWNHIACVRDGSTIRLYVNGVQAGTANIGTASIWQNTTRNLYLFGPFQNNSASTGLNGYVSNYRLLKGTCQYPSGTTFTPPSSPLTAITNTTLLTCQSNRFVDNSTGAIALTPGGNTSVQAFSPFAPTAAYSAATNGGSGYFDGTTDYLTVANNSAFQFGTGDFTWEAWVYLDSTISPLNHGLMASSTLGSGYWALLTSAGTMYWQNANGSSNLFSASFSGYWNSWTHVVVSRVGGTTRMFFNGTQVASASDATNYNGSAGNYEIGRDNDNSAYTKGYIAGLRILKGTGYTSITVPTAPPTAITNTSLLCNFTNAGITDATAKNDLETVGNAQISNGQAKWGSTSMYFDGTGDYLITPSKAITSLEGDFTVEMWIYRTAGNNFFFTLGDSQLSTGFDLYIGNTGSNLRLYSNNGVAIDAALSGISFPATTWVHVAIVRYNGTVKLYVSGSQAGSNWSSSASFSGIVYVGAEFYNGSITGTMNGYMQDLRVTKGIARYTQNFTPPTAAFQLL